jgi:hypothetical protein
LARPIRRRLGSSAPERATRASVGIGARVDARVFVREIDRTLATDERISTSQLPCISSRETRVVALHSV